MQFQVVLGGDEEVVNVVKEVVVIFDKEWSEYFFMPSTYLLP